MAANLVTPFRKGLTARASLVIDNGAANGDWIDLGEQTQRVGTLVIQGSAAMTNVIHVGISLDGGTTWAPVYIDSVLMTIVAGSVNIFTGFPLAGLIRLQTVSGNEGAARTFVVYALNW